MAFGRRCVWTGARAPCEHSQRRSATSWHAPPACNRHAVWLPPPTMAAQRRRARGLDTCRRASPPPSRTTSVRSWTYAASAAFEARTCSTCSAVARKRRRIGSARRDAIPGMPSRARTSGWRTVAHGALLRRPAPLKSRSTSLLASPSHTKNWMQRGRHSGTRTTPLRPTIRPRTLRRWVTRLAGAQRSCRAREEGWGRHCTGCDRRERCLRVRHRSLLTWASCM